eukprot:197399_1
MAEDNADQPDPPITFKKYDGEHELHSIQELIDKDLSEPYSVFTYRYFLNNWSSLCTMAMQGSRCIGVIICRLGKQADGRKDGYIAMLAVDKRFRKRGIGTELVKHSVTEMMRQKASEVFLETEVTNRGALKIYEKLGFSRELRLTRYYMAGTDAYRLRLWLEMPFPDQNIV